jgi:hypothetical protein
MNQTAIFWPMLAHVLLVYVVYAVMGKRPSGAVRSGEAKPGQFKGRANEPAGSVTVANNLLNQFELPVLFHVLCLALQATNGVNYLTLTLAWLFILTRYLHAVVHLTGNNVMLRGQAFAAGAAILAIGWVWFALHIAGVA